jgi:hypothetical protein
MDVNETIVNTWLNTVKKFFTITSIDYGQFHNDIDILAININLKEVWDCEIKVRTGGTRISNNSNKQNGFLHFVKTLNDSTREAKSKEYLTDNYEIKKKFITTRSLFGSVRNQNKWIDEFKNKNIDVIFFDEIVNDLSDYAKGINKSNNEVVQILRLFFIHQELNNK